MSNTATPTLDKMEAECLELELWCAEQGLPYERADLLQQREGLTDAQRAWLRDFVARWQLMLDSRLPLIVRRPLPFSRIVVTSEVDQGGVEVGTVLASNITAVFGRGRRSGLASYDFKPNAEGVRRGLVAVSNCPYLDRTLADAMKGPAA